MGYKKCEICKEYHYDTERCEPIYWVYYQPYMGDKPKEIRADSHDNAALKFAQYYNIRCEYCLMNKEIEVKVEKDGVVKYFKVGAEPDVYYSSSEINKV